VWSRYWFDGGGRISLAIVRVAVASSVLLSLARITHGTLVAAPSLYRPVGIWMVLGAHPPPRTLIEVLWVVAWISSFAMLVGLATRTSTVVSFVSSVALASLVFATSPTWSHQYNVVFLAQLALVGSRSGDALSIDDRIRRLRRLPALELANAYQWSLRLVQLAVALMFVSAVFHKLLYGHFTLRWAFSDNLRNQLLVRFDLAQLPRPAIVDWVIDHPWRYRTTAMLNLVSQAAPLLAIVHVRRPGIRALAGLFFILETLALGLVVDLWNLHWLPLAAVFIDWEYLLGQRHVRPVAGGLRRPVRIFIAAFVSCEILTAFVPTLDQRLNTYPFSSFPMFAKVRARAPYYDHQPYDVPGESFEVTAVQRPVALQRWLDHTQRTLYTIRDPDELQRHLTAILAQAQRDYPQAGVRGLRVWLTVFEAPPYPAPAHVERHPIAIVGELAGTFHTQLGTVRGTPGTPGARLELGAVPPRARLLYYRDDSPTPHDLGPLASRSIDLSRLYGNPLYLVIVVDGTPWLAASYATWEW
jgi:hypothetical protein